MRTPHHTPSATIATSLAQARLAPLLCLSLTFDDRSTGKFNERGLLSPLTKLCQFILRERFAKHDVNGSRKESQSSAGHRFVSTRNADGIDRQLASTNERHEARFEFTDIAELAARAFGKNADEKSMFDALDGVTNGSGAGGIAIDRHHVSIPESPADKRNGEERVSRQKTDRSLQRQADQKGIQEALMIDQHETATLARHVLKTSTLIPKPEGEDESQDVLDGEPMHVATRRMWKWQFGIFRHA